MSGLASGVDWSTIVDKLISVSRVPQDRMYTEKSTLTSKTSAINEIKTLVASLKTSISALGSTDSLLKKSASGSATATADTPIGTYDFNLITQATTAKLNGGGSLANLLDADDPLSSISVGRTITGGTFTVDGVQLTISTADSLNEVLDQITSSVPGITATYNSVTDAIELTKGGGGQIVLGASNDTSNFLQAMHLTGGNSPLSSAAPSLSTVSLSSPIDSANLSGWAAPGTSSSFKINGVSIEYDSAADSIQSVLTRINNSSAGVTAIYDLSSGSFSLRNKSTGNVGITVSDDVGGLAGALKLTSAGGATLSAGTDAVFTVNGGGSLTSRSNVLDETAHGIAGLSVTASALGSQEITVSIDNAAAKTTLESFVSSFNAVQSAIEKYTKVTVSGSKVTAGILSGNHEISDISKSLRRVLFDAGSGVSGSIKRITDLGLDFNGVDNTISITSESTLTSALENSASDIASYFTTADTGLVDRLDTFLDKLVDDSGVAAGTFKTALDSYEKQQKSLDTQIANIERQLTSQRALLESSFIAMETAQAKYQSQADYLTKTFSDTSSS